jgi:hypothetical protein
MSLRTRLMRLERSRKDVNDVSVAIAVREALKTPDYLEYLERRAMDEDEAVSLNNRIQRLERDTRGTTGSPEPRPGIVLTPERFRALPLEERIRLLQSGSREVGSPRSAARDEFSAIPLEERRRMLREGTTESGS